MRNSLHYLQLPNPPPDQAITENGNCQECRKESRRKGPTCAHCALHAMILRKKQELMDHKFITVIGAIREFNKSLKGGYGVAAGKNEDGDRGTLENPVLAVHVDDLAALEAIEEEASTFMRVADEAKSTAEALLKHWESHQNLMGGMDELNECMMTARLRRHGESYNGGALVEVRSSERSEAKEPWTPPFLTS